MNENPNTLTASSSDKRYFPRWQVKNRVVYHYDGNPNFHDARSCDLSCAGVSVVSRFAILPSQRLKMRIYLVEDEHVEVNGQSVWSREVPEGYLTGISFVNLPSPIQEKILQYAFEIKKETVVKHWFEGWKTK